MGRVPQKGDFAQYLEVDVVHALVAEGRAELVEHVQLSFEVVEMELVVLLDPRPNLLWKVVRLDELLNVLQFVKLRRAKGEPRSEGTSKN